jgi:hypothetical protein
LLAYKTTNIATVNTSVISTYINSEYTTFFCAVRTTIDTANCISVYSTVSVTLPPAKCLSQLCADCPTICYSQYSADW